MRLLISVLWRKRSKLRCSAIVQSVMFWQKTIALYQHKYLTSMMILGLLSSHWACAPCSHWINSYLFCMPQFFGLKHRAIWLTAKPWLKLVHLTQQWSQAQQKNINQNAWNRKRSRWPSQVLDLVEMLWQDLNRACITKSPQICMKCNSIANMSGKKPPLIMWEPEHFREYSHSSH